MLDFKALSRELYAAVLFDVMDECGFPHQAIRPFVRPLDDRLVRMGCAWTGLFAERYSVRDCENP